MWFFFAVTFIIYFQKKLWCYTHSNSQILIEICCPLLTSLLSGSPILQNGNLVGAVTHVFMNDPTRGYGIFIENMLAEAEKISD